MAINYTEQVKYTGKGYLDAKMQPVAAKEDLMSIPRSQRFVGLTVTVLDDGTGAGPVDYWLKDNVSTWVPKVESAGVPISGDDVD